MLPKFPEIPLSFPEEKPQPKRRKKTPPAEKTETKKNVKKVDNDLDVNLIGSGICQMFGAGLDYILQGNGKIQKRWNENTFLKNAVGTEIGSSSKLASNRARLILAAGTDTTAGFIQARKESAFDVKKLWKRKDESGEGGNFSGMFPEGEWKNNIGHPFAGLDTKEKVQQHSIDIPDRPPTGSMGFPGPKGSVDSKKPKQRAPRSTDKAPSRAQGKRNADNSGRSSPTTEAKGGK